MPAKGLPTPTTVSGQTLSLLTRLCLPGSQCVSCAFLRQQRPKATRDLSQTPTLGLNQNTMEGHERSLSLRAIMLRPLLGPLHRNVIHRGGGLPLGPW